MSQKRFRPIREQMHDAVSYCAWLGSGTGSRGLCGGQNRRALTFRHVRLGDWMKSFHLLTSFLSVDPGNEIL